MSHYHNNIVDILLKTSWTCFFCNIAITYSVSWEQKFNYTIIASYEGIQDSFRFWIPRCGFRNLFQWITWFLDSNCLTCISGFKAQNLGFHNKNCPNSGFHKQRFPGFQNPLSDEFQAITWGDHKKKKSVKAGYHDLNSSYSMFSAPWQSLPLLPF